jgi:hypothetical protein
MSGTSSATAGSGRIPARSTGFHQTWLRDAATGHYHLDVFREPHDGHSWICRRDHTIVLDYDPQHPWLPRLAD